RALRAAPRYVVLVPGRSRAPVRFAIRAGRLSPAAVLAGPGRREPAARPGLPGRWARWVSTGRPVPPVLTAIRARPAHRARRGFPARLRTRARPAPRGRRASPVPAGRPEPTVRPAPGAQPASRARAARPGLRARGA